MKNNLNAYYFILNKIINNDHIFKDSQVLQDVDKLRVLLSTKEYSNHLKKLEKANKIALGHVQLEGENLHLENLKTPFYKVSTKDDNEDKSSQETSEKSSKYHVYKPQSLTADFTKNIRKENPDFTAEIITQFQKFIQELEVNGSYLPAEDCSHTEHIMWQETVETLALKHLSFMGISTDKNSDNCHPVSLFDHMRLTSAIYNVLEDENSTTDDPFLYIQGDFFGIQKFIFSDVNNTEKNASKILRGRSAFVSILCELTAIRILNKLKLPASARILSTAGKFHILAANTEDNRKELDEIALKIDNWFKRETYSMAGIGLAYSQLSEKDIDGTHNFGETLTELFNELSVKKYARLNLLSASDDAEYIHAGYVEKFTKYNPCDFMPYLPAMVSNDNYADGLVSRLADIQINLGADIPKSKYLVIYAQDVLKAGYLINSKGNDMEILGYKIGIIDKNQISDSSKIIREKVVRIYDINDKETSTDNRTYGKKFISAHTPTVFKNEVDTRKPATFNDISQENLQQDRDGNLVGVPNISSLKGDIDNLGNIFQDSHTPITLARTLYRSRMLELYFSYRLSHLCSGAFRNLYVVFAGGDDFFLLGCSKDLIKFVDVFTKDFQEFTDNPAVHFSCGLGVFKSKHPVNYISTATEEYLEKAKKYQQNPYREGLADKNAICCYGQTVSFFEDKPSLDYSLKTKVSDWANLMYINDDFERNKKLLLSTSAMYKWIKFSEMAGNTRGKNYRNAIWRSQFTYQIVRLTENNNDDISQSYLLTSVLRRISDHKETFKIPLFTYLYNNRKYEGALT